MIFAGRTALVAALAAAAALPAAAQEAPRIRHIVVEGNQRIEAETIRSYMAIAVGDPYSAERVNQSVKSLFNTGLFSNVTISHQGDTLYVRVAENPIINRLVFQGNHHISNKQLKAEVQLRSRMVYTRTKVQSDVRRILDLYRHDGRFAATVDPEIIKLSENRVNLIFNIHEGPPTYVENISFIGNHFYGASTLKEVISTKEERWYRFLTNDDTYDPDRLTYDRELLRRFYLKHGFADFHVTSAVAELTPNREGFFITFTIDEGHRYKFGKSTIKASLRHVKVSTLKPLITTEAGDWYDADKVQKIIQHMTDTLGNQGFAFVDVRPEIKVDRKTRTVQITYDIRQGPRVYVDRIEITGNTRTLDKVIRRQISLVEGDAFNTAKLRRSQQRIRDLNFFSKVQVTNVPSETAPDRTVIKVHVQEKSTGSLSFGVGWSTIAGPLAQASVREANLLGTGQSLGVSAGIGTQLTNYDLSFTNPYFMNRKLAAGFDIFDTSRMLQTESGFDSSTIGLDLRTGYSLSEHLSQSLRYMIKQDRVTNVATTASRYIQEQAGTATLSSIQQTLFYDRRDSKIDPTEGYYLQMDNELAGLGGTEDFVRNNVGAAQYFPIADQVILSVSAHAGIITPFAGKSIRITQRYFLGGQSVRGFANAGISPRDSVTGDALGGLWDYYGSVQLKFPLGLPQEYGIAGETFTDFGGTGQTDTS